MCQCAERECRQTCANQGCECTHAQKCNWVFCSAKREAKRHPRRRHEGPEGKQRYSSARSLTSALDGGGWLTPWPGRFTAGKTTQCLFRGGRGGPRAGEDGCGKSPPPPPGLDPRTVQPVASRHTDYEWASKLLQSKRKLKCLGKFS